MLVLKTAAACAVQGLKNGAQRGMPWLESWAGSLCYHLLCKGFGALVWTRMENQQLRRKNTAGHVSRGCSADSELGSRSVREQPGGETNNIYTPCLWNWK